MTKQRLVVIGNGMAGMKTVEELLLSAPEQYDISVFGSEPYGNYNRIMLSAVLSGEKEVEDIIINDRKWYRDHGIRLFAGPEKTVVKIERGLRRVVAQDGTWAEYDRLLIATGSKPALPELPGIESAGVVSFRDILDVNTMLRYAENHRHAVVLGGGLLGLEAANGLVQRGMQVTVVHSNELLLNRQLDRTAAQMLQAQLEQRGLQFRLAARAEQVIADAAGHVEALALRGGDRLACDLLVVAVGITPNTVLARKAGLYCERGIVVNDTLQTYDPAVYAVGECIQHRGQVFGLVAPLFEQAKVCANHLSAHGFAGYVTLPAATKLKVTGINIFSLGDINAAAGSDEIRYCDHGRAVYKKLVVKGNRLLGAVLYGDTKDGVWYQQLLENAADLAPIRAQMIFGQAYALPA